MIYSNYLNLDEIRNDIAKYEKEAIEKNCDIYIVTKGGLYSKKFEILNVFCDVENLIKYLDRKNYKTNKNQYYLFDYLGFLKDFCKDTNKYRTFDKKKVWKLNKTLELGNKTEVLEIMELKKKPEIQVYLRKKKFERILKK